MGGMASVRGVSMNSSTYFLWDDVTCERGVASRYDGEVVVRAMKARSCIRANLQRNEAAEWFAISAEETWTTEEQIGVVWTNTEVVQDRYKAE